MKTFTLMTLTTDSNNGQAIVFGEKADWQEATQAIIHGGCSTAERPSQTAFSPQTIREILRFFKPCLGPNRLAIFAAGFLLAGLVIGKARAQDAPQKVVVPEVAVAAEGPSAPKADGGQDAVTIRAIEPESPKQSAGKMTWLGVSVEEVPGALTDQLGLKPGEGMVVNFVSAQSPAARAELRKSDVLVRFDDQMLVDPVQLRKLVQMHREGDDVKITFYRGGKKQSVTAKLAKKSWNELSINTIPLQEGMRTLQVSMDGLKGLPEGFNDQMYGLSQSMKQLGLNKEQMKLEVEHTMEQTRRAIRDAVREAREAQDTHKILKSVSGELLELAGGGVDLGKDTTVVVKSDGKSAKIIVKTDDSGSYIIVAAPDKHLTAHDQYGKLLFDGPIATPEQQQKVSRGVWEKVKPLAEQMDAGKIDFNQPIAREDTTEKQKP
jgi:hypothetical protein